MDPITASALAALAGGAGGEAGRQVSQSLASLVRRPFRRGDDDPQEPGTTLRVSTAEPELTALQHSPADPARAQALVTALGVRAALDAQFRSELDEWWQRAQPVVTGGGNVYNNINNSSTFHAPVVQGRDSSGITFTTPVWPAGGQ
ncbi:MULTISPECIES: hypothetical protein [Streptomyces]|uniref:hypothetical protein n=1 Tax=Streptomyces TaxID=1883 RepID=UPI00163C4A85|nr:MULTISPECIES: hypothetical protein [Streptomyces]MBC2876708.1 hypothetical protein [Streptomyces sp. TYQ1024]UBI36336.1 hypothetical protein K7I03_07575 [Streptomyces mobaraensis]UKW28930.1 hypothetical protein MCU78_07560 [Streptomyces sp. TYQ1024]